MKYNLKKIGEEFQIGGAFIGGETYGSGHINDTFAVSYAPPARPSRYIFQRINHRVFKNPPALMDNIRRVTEHQQSKIRPGNQAARRTLSLVSTQAAQPYYLDQDGNYWRVYVFIENARTYDVIQSPAQAYQAARAFGEFQSQLVDLPGKRLHETIPDFHHTPKRFQAFDQALATDAHNRAAAAGAEIDFVLRRRDWAGLLLRLNTAGTIPERITHNDTKINNVMLDDASGEGICVIDLDTVMPGLALYDFGDLVRTSTSPAAEDERDLTKVKMQMQMYEALVRGYLEAAAGFLTKTEKEHLAFGGKLITLEIGLRFLTDYLSGDAYFKTHRIGQNLDRCRTQFRLVADIERQEDEMRAVAEKF